MAEEEEEEEDDEEEEEEEETEIEDYLICGRLKRASSVLSVFCFGMSFLLFLA